MHKLRANPLSSAAVDVLMQLFVGGPTWDGNVISKSGRNELVEVGLAFHENGWASLTPFGVSIATTWDRKSLRNWRDQRWYEKLRDV